MVTPENAKECCVGQTTPHCPQCGEPIQGYPFIEIKVYFESRLKRAEERLKARQADVRIEARPAGVSARLLTENVAKAAAIVERWTRWTRVITEAMNRPNEPETT